MMLIGLCFIIQRGRTMKKINFRIIGTGRIAGQFAMEASKNNKIKLVGVCARNYEKTKTFAKENNIEKTYLSSDKLLEDSNIDAVYIATFHPTHFPYAMKALEAGKHVLCEKPAVLNSSDLEIIIKKAREKKLLFMEAMTIGFNPVYIEIKKEIEAGTIGEVVHVESSYGSVSTKAHKHNPNQAGGALYDIGIYNIFLMTDILGVPLEVSTISRNNKWGVEGAVSCIGKHINGSTSSFYATMDSFSGESAKIIGTEGVIDIPTCWTTAEKFIVKTTHRRENQFENKKDVWLGYEIDAFAETLMEGRIENITMTYEKSMDLHYTIEKIKKALGFTYDEVEIIIH